MYLTVVRYISYNNLCLYFVKPSLTGAGGEILGNERQVELRRGYKSGSIAVFCLG